MPDKSVKLKEKTLLVLNKAKIVTLKEIPDLKKVTDDDTIYRALRFYTMNYKGDRGKWKPTKKVN